MQDGRRGTFSGRCTLSMAAEILFLIETLENPRWRPRLPCRLRPPPDRRSLSPQVCCRLTACSTGRVGWDATSHPTWR